MITNTCPKCGTPSALGPAADVCTSAVSPRAATATARRRRTRMPADRDSGAGSGQPRSGDDSVTSEPRSVLEAQDPLAAGQHGEGLSLPRLSAEHVPNGLPT